MGPGDDGEWYGDLQRLTTPPPFARPVRPFDLQGGRYQVKAELGRGRNSQVLFAVDQKLSCPRAIKALRGGDPALAAALDRERRILGQLNHRGLPRLYEAFQENGLSCLVLDYVAAPALACTSPRPLHEALEIVLHLMDVLVYLHGQSPPVIHGDIKPANLLVSPDHYTTLVDFGAAHVGTGPAAVLLATPGYAPREQMQGGAPRPSWDLYAASVVLWQMLMAQDPAGFPDGLPVPTGLPAEAAEVLSRALHPNPRNRYPTARELKTALEQARSLTTDFCRCPKCRLSHPKTVYFCHRCGELLRPVPVGMPRPTSPVRRLGADRLARALAAALPQGDPQRVLLRLDAEALARPLGFEVLISVDHNNIEEMPHQLKVVRQALKVHGGRSLLADEVGLGKTIEAGIIRDELKLRGLVRRTLILTPPHLCQQWREEMAEKFGERFVIWEGRDGLPLKGTENLIVSHHRARGSRNNQRPRQALCSCHWDLVVVDEAHHARNRQTLLYKLLRELPKNYLLLLTATPIQNHLEELWNLINLLRPGLLGSTWAECQRKYGIEGLEVRHFQQLRADLRRAMVRTRRSEAYVKFPERVAHVRTLQASSEEASLYQKVTELVIELGHSFSAWKLTLIHLQQRLTSSPEAVAESLQTLACRPGAPRSSLLALADEARTLQGRPSTKLQALLSVLEQVRDRVVVFSDHRPTQEMLLRRLRAREIPCGVYRGSDPESIRARHNFENRGGVLVVSMAGNEGLNLHQHSHVMVNYDLPWNPMRIEQRIGRLQRLGQRRTVLVFNLVLEGTIEEQILRVLQKKIRLFELAIGQLDLILGDLIREENSFEDRIWNCLLQARAQEHLDSLLEKEFARLGQGPTRDGDVGRLLDRLT
jgi:superfamily II DNA or RNA helicase